MSEAAGGTLAARPAPRAAKSASAFRTISEVAEELDVAQHVLRFWESKFPQVKPLKRGGGRRYYRPEDVELLRQIRALLYQEGYTIKGAQKLLRVRGRKHDDDEADRPPPVRRGARVPSETAAAATGAETAAPAAGGEPSRAWRRRLDALRGELLAVRAILRGAS